MEKKNETLGERLKRYRTEKKLTVDEVARRIGVAPSTYREWEYGREIRGEPYLALAETFGTTLHGILVGSAAGPHETLQEIDEILLRLKKLKADLAKAL